MAVVGAGGALDAPVPSFGACPAGWSVMELLEAPLSAMAEVESGQQAGAEGLLSRGAV